MNPKIKPLKRFRAPAAQTGKVKRLIQERWGMRWHENQRMLLEEERNLREGKPAVWKNDRNYYQHYNPFFSQGLAAIFGKAGELSIVDSLMLVAQDTGAGTKRKPLRIIDDGAGKGFGISQLVQEARKKGLTVEATALTFVPNKDLTKEKTEGRVDHIITGPAELFAPKKPVDAIISLAGSIQQIIPMLTKEHLLKFAYSLKRGGILMMSFNTTFHYPKNSLARTNAKKYFEGLIRAFNKRGFEAKIGFNRAEWDFSNENSPQPKYAPANAAPYMLIIRRISG